MDRHVVLGVLQFGFVSFYNFFLVAVYIEILTFVFIHDFAVGSFLIFYDLQLGRSVIIGAALALVIFYSRLELLVHVVQGLLRLLFRFLASLIDSVTCALRTLFHLVAGILSTLANIVAGVLSTLLNAVARLFGFTLNILTSALGVLTELVTFLAEVVFRLLCFLLCFIYSLLKVRGGAVNGFFGGLFLAEFVAFPCILPLLRHGRQTECGSREACQKYLFHIDNFLVKHSFD